MEHTFKNINHVWGTFMLENTLKSWYERLWAAVTGNNDNNDDDDDIYYLSLNPQTQLS